MTTLHAAGTEARPTQAVRATTTTLHAAGTEARPTQAVRATTTTLHAAGTEAHRGPPHPSTRASGTMKRHVDDVARAYDAWAPHYDVDMNPLVALDDVVTPRLFGALSARHAVLDAGCGTGRHVEKLVATGARVTGIDASAGMLARASKRTNVAERATLLVHDLRHPLPFADGAFDLVICTLVLEHAASLEEPIASLARVTKKGGAVVVSDIHPVMRATGTQANFTDPSTGEDVLPPSHAHSIADYVRAARTAGLHLEVVLEHEGTPRLVERTPRARKYLGKPMLLALRFTRS